jgi:hypothetical protein
MKDHRLRRVVPFVVVGAALTVSSALLIAAVADGAMP